MTEELQQAELLLPEEPLKVDPLIRWGKDELNLAEFPLTVLAHRVTPGQKTLEFKDTIWDRGAQQLVERKLTVTAADKFGLPTALDDDVILALVQLTKRNGFQTKTVAFTKYEIIQILDWRDESKSYKRVQESLDRWLGVTLKYENAWWNPSEQAWMTEGFHIIDRLTTVEDDTGRKRDAFVWNDMVFRSFQQGNLKTLDLGLYKKLQGPIARRLYRLLDKRFYRRYRVEFDLEELAHHKLGFSRKGHVGTLKQRLNPAIKELEEIGFITKMPLEERYSKIRASVWHVIFEKGEKAVVTEEQSAALPIALDSRSDLEQCLETRGVTKTKARRIATKYPEDYVLHKMEILDYLIQTNPPNNPAGFLVKAIEEDYAAPAGFRSKSELEEERRAKEQVKANRLKKKQEADEKALRQKESEAKKAKEMDEKVEMFLNSLPPAKRAEAIEEAYNKQRRGGEYSDWIDKEGPFGEMARRFALCDYVMSKLATEESSYK